MAHQSSEPADIQALIAWVNHIAADYDARMVGTDFAPEVRVVRHEIDQLRAALTNPYTYMEKPDDLRRLMIGGLLENPIAKLDPDADTSSLIIQQFALAALWPLVTAGMLQLSFMWGHTMRTLSSSELAMLLQATHFEHAQARTKSRRIEIKERFVRELMQPRYAEGIRNCLKTSRTKTEVKQYLLL